MAMPARPPARAARLRSSPTAAKRNSPVSRPSRTTRTKPSQKRAAAAGSAAALFWLGFVLVVREGLETGLFLFAAVGEDRSLAALAGGLAGIAMAAGLGYAVYRGGSRLNVRVFFTVLNVILLGFRTYLVLRGVGELGELAAAGEAAELVARARCLIRAPGRAVEEPVLRAVLRDLDAPRSSGFPPETGERVVPGAARSERESDGQEQDRRGETRDGSPSAAVALPLAACGSGDDPFTGLWWEPTT